ncbi:MAG: hypothetical protein IPO48_20050 [Saprospiraceae bacterium]|nr:hypothetical protein [Saprospiraceae bacterium]
MQQEKNLLGITLLVIFLVNYQKEPSEMGDSLGAIRWKRMQKMSSPSNHQGFLNVSLSESLLKQRLDTNNQHLISDMPNQMAKSIVELSPDANKPPNLGHIRNILLGWSCSKNLES